jgi:galacturan 1,4-alpha-galacturonidase
MSLAISNAKNVVIKNFSVIQPQFWASIIIESENVLIQDFYVNATSYNPSVSSSFPFEFKLRTGNVRQKELAGKY